MTDEDFNDFGHAWVAAYELCLRGRSPTPASVVLAFEALRQYSLEDITAALTRHLRDPENGRFGLTVADVVRQIDGPAITADQVIGAALSPKTPLAVLCRIEIGSWNLSHWSAQQLRSHAERCIALLPEWRRRLATAKTTEHEKEIFLKYGVRMNGVQSLQPPADSLHGEHDHAV